MQGSGAVVGLLALCSLQEWVSPWELGYTLCVCVCEVVLEFGLYWNWKSLRDTLEWEVILGLGI